MVRPTPSLESIRCHLDALLRIPETDDFPGAHNGLQVESDRPVRRVAAAVDACEAVIARAVADGADMLLVHHGLFWSGGAPVTGRLYRKLRMAIEGGLAIYSAHLPLDAHPEFGNNAILAKAIGLRRTEPFFEEKGVNIGLCGPYSGTLERLVARVEAAVGGPVKVRAGGPARPKRVGVVTGAAGSGVGRAALAGADTLVTGEGPHHAFLDAEELGVNLILAGHYATETFGVRALAGHLAEKFGVGTFFIDHPTGL